MYNGEEKLIRKMVVRALNDADTLPTTERADLHQAAAAVLINIDKPAAELAAHTAMLLREADRHQLKFLELLGNGTLKV
jgi:hypothetical protein